MSSSTIQHHTSEFPISITDLYKSFGQNHVLKGVSLELTKGENLVVLGKSGSGKSVLIKCIVGLIRPEKGSIKAFGQEITGLSERELDQVRTKIGFLFQGSALYDSLTVEENMGFAMMRLRKDIGRKELDRLIDEALENVGLMHTRKLMPSELSGGMKKRVALARTIIMKPEVMLYDEPTTGLDPITSREISSLILHLQKQYQMSSVIITHDIPCAQITANRMITLINGLAYASGTFDELKHHQDKEVNSFFE